MAQDRFGLFFLISALVIATLFATYAIAALAIAAL
jgi:hypothetical protein